MSDEEDGKKKKKKKKDKKPKSKGIGSKKMPKDAKWCSWCLKLCGHEVVEENFMRRDVYKCKQCSQRTLQCRGFSCTKPKGMARGMPDWDEEYCAVCSDRVQSWEEPAAVDAGPSGTRCSWCLQKATFTTFQKNILGRNKFECDNCGARVLTCRKCDNMAKVHEDWDDELCASCDGSITDWDDPKPYAEGSSIRIAWCQNCQEKGEHVIEQKNMLSANIFKCSLCQAKNKACEECEIGSVLVDAPEEEDGEEGDNQCLGCLGGVQGAAAAAKAAGRVPKVRSVVKKEITMEDLERNLKERIVLMSETKRYQPGQTVLEQGNTQRALYMVNKGDLSVLVDVQGEVKEVTTLHPPETFGEITFLQGGAASASIVAVGPAEVYVVNRAKIEGNSYMTNDEHSEWFYKFLAIKLALRLRKTSEQQSKGGFKAANPKGSLAASGAAAKKAKSGSGTDPVKMRERFGLSGEPDMLVEVECSGQTQSSKSKKGQLFIFQTHVCYYAKVFGSATKYAVPFTHITDVQTPGGRIIHIFWGSQQLTLNFAAMAGYQSAIDVIHSNWTPDAAPGDGGGDVAAGGGGGGDGDAIDELISGAEQVTFTPGQTLIKDGEDSQAIYQITSGSVEIMKRGVALASLGEGQIFGELSFLGGGVASASVVAAATGADALRLDGVFVREKIADKPSLGGRFYKMIANIVASRLKKAAK